MSSFICPILTPGSGARTRATRPVIGDGGSFPFMTCMGRRLDRAPEAMSLPVPGASAGARTGAM